MVGMGLPAFAWAQEPGQTLPTDQAIPSLSFSHYLLGWLSLSAF
jgi:hypothetical protein